MLPGKGHNITDISRVTVAILGSMGVTTLTSNTRMTKRPEKPQKPITAATISGCPVPTGLMKNMVWSTVIFPNCKLSQPKSLLEEMLCQSMPVSWQLSPECCMLPTSQSSFMLNLSGFLDIVPLCISSYFPATFSVSNVSTPGFYSKSSVDWYLLWFLAASIALWRWNDLLRTNGPPPINPVPGFW